MKRLLLVMLLLVMPLAAMAVEPDEVLEDPVLEARAREISKGLRCLVCQNQSIDDSNAGLARDLRVIVRERLVAGDTDAQVIAFAVDRYGDFVLLEPPFKATTWLLWIGPALTLILGGIGVGVFLRRRRVVGAGAASGTAPMPLTKAERARLDALLGENGERERP
jgi:cytochrome c-type biogenesis protein CcmH